MPDFSVPILLILYKRYDSLLTVIDRLKAVGATRLYAFADGPSSDDDVDACRRARSAVESIDWQCDVRRRFEESNLGCGRGPATAVSWFFEQEQKGIILEDDCVPSNDFFAYCEELLERYDDDPRVMEICGTNLLGQWPRGEQSYLFSQYGSPSGWASWSRAWKLYDYEIRAFPDKASRDILASVYGRGISSLYFSRFLKKTYRNSESITWWDYQWRFIKNVHGGLSIIPRVNLIDNVGFADSAATHSFFGGSAFRVSPDIRFDFPLKHPTLVGADREYDRMLFAKTMNARALISSMVPSKLKRRIARLLRSGRLYMDRMSQVC